jgi:ABC-type polysaccharide/polyol phosphate export permease
MSATSEAPAAFRHAAARPGPFALLAEALDEIRSRRRLVRYLLQADIRKKGADTFLGNFWWIMDPLLQMGVYVVFVSLILAVKTPDFPLFVLSAVLPWKWFTSTVTDASQSVISQGSLIRQIQFPKLVLPTATSMAGVVGFVFGLIPLAGIMLLYPHRLSPFLVVIPVIAFVQFVFSLGLAFLVSAVNVFFRDLGNVLRHILRVWFYLSPGLYSLSVLDASATFKANPLLRTIAHSNPVAILFEAYRAVIYGSPNGPPHAPDWSSLFTLLVASVVLLAIGTMVFKRLEPSYAKVL